MDKQPLLEAKALLETAKKRLLDTHRDIVNSPGGLDWDLAADVINLARSVDEANCRLEGLLQNGPQPSSSSPVAAVRRSRRSKSDYSVLGEMFVKTGSSWEHTLSKAEFTKAVQAIKEIAYKSNAPKAAYDLDDVAKATQVAKRYVYDVYTVLYELGLVEQQHRNVYYITKKQADGLNVEDIWKQIKQMSKNNP